MIGGWRIFNQWDRRANGVIDFPPSLQVSSNVAMVQEMRQVKPATSFGNRLERESGSTHLGLNDLPVCRGRAASKPQQFTKPADLNRPRLLRVRVFSLTPLKLLQLHGMRRHDASIEISPQHHPWSALRRCPWLSRRSRRRDQLA